MSNYISSGNKYSDLFLDKNDLHPNNHQGARLLNIGHKGFEGHVPAIGALVNGTNYEAHLSSALYVSQPVIAKVITTPGFMSLMPKPDLWRKSFVSIIEEHPTAITGFNSTLTVDTESQTVGATGEQQEVPKNTKRTRTNLTFEIPERMHKGISTFIGLCISYGTGDYIVGRPLASDFINSLDDVGGGWSPDLYSATVIFIEPDVTRLEVVDAWLGVQFFFKTTGDRTAKRNLNAGGDTASLSLETAGIYLGTAKVFQFARQLLPKISNLRAVPDKDMELPNSDIQSHIRDF